jgi:hypothetical protein
MTQPRRWLDQYCFTLLFLALMLCAGVALADMTLPAETKTVVINGLCDGWKAWRERDGDLWVGCPGSTPPAGAVELRPYYRLP